MMGRVEPGAAPSHPGAVRLVVRDAIPSTQVEARRLATDAHAADGTLVLAAEQTAGHGRQHRSWVSPRGGLYVTAVMRSPVAPDMARWMPLAGAVAFVESLEEWLRGRGVVDASPRLRVKWPNDILLDEAKLAGVLVQREQDARGGWYLLMGLGANLLDASHGSGRRERILDQPTISLTEANLPPPEPAALAVRWWDAVVRWRERLLGGGVDDLRGAVDERCWARGERVRLLGAGDTAVEGVCEGVGAAGGIVLRVSEGDDAAPREFAAGTLRRG